jgi:shikimate 5-dehydrogenase
LEPGALGALVTTHKIDFYEFAREIFDELDQSSVRTGEISCISKRSGRLIGHAKDPITAGLSLDAVLGMNYFGSTGGHVLNFGAGGSGKAIALHLISKKERGDRPERFVMVNRTQERLDKARAMVESIKTDTDTDAHTDIAFDYVLSSDAASNDALMASLPEGSVVINSTGMGKDRPGSPVSDAGLFPLNGVAWEINYRGELDFWHQAMQQAADRNLVVEDGWLYFLHGWSQHIAEVLGISMTEESFAKLANIAADLRPKLVPRRRTGAVSVWPSA